MTLRGSTLLLLLLAMFWAACGTVEPKADDELVVEGYVVTDALLPTIMIRRSTSLRSGLPADRPVEEASVSIEMDGMEVPYRDAGAGRYVPMVDVHAGGHQDLRLHVDRGDQSVRGETKTPPPIRIDSAHVIPQSVPIEAVLIDTLNLSPDARVTGYVYLVDVDIFWTARMDDDDMFVRLQLRPDSSLVSRVIDLFLRTEQIVREDAIERVGMSSRRWSGVYAVQVDSLDDPLPEHRLRVALLRSGRDYARFALSRDASDRREPEGNVRGGLGIFAGVSVDSLRLDVGLDGYRSSTSTE